MNGSSDPIPRRFTHRTTASVLLIFLVTMVVFLSAAYRSEKSLHYEETFEHLTETSAVLSLLPNLGQQPTASAVAALEKRLAERTGVPHRLFLVGPEFSVAAAAESSMIGGDIRTQLNLVPYGPLDSGRATAEDDRGTWLASSMPLDDRGGRLYLLRSRKESEGFVGRFWRLHGLHIGVTVLLFFVLLKFLGERYVRRPIGQLAAHVQRVEAGEFLTQPERYEKDEFGWLAARFTQMGLRLREAVERLVRTEKYAAASAVAYVVATEAMEPLNSLERHIAYLEGLASGGVELKSLAASLEKDRQELVKAVVRLEKLGPGPQDIEADAGGDPGDHKGPADG